MSSNARIRDDLFKFPCVSFWVGVVKIRNNLTDLAASEQMLLRGDKECDKRLLFGQEHSGKTIIEEAFMPEAVPAPIGCQNAFGCHLIEVVRIDLIELLARDRQLLRSCHLLG